MPTGGWIREKMKSWLAEFRDMNGTIMSSPKQAACLTFISKQAQESYSRCLPTGGYSSVMRSEPQWISSSSREALVENAGSLSHSWNSQTPARIVLTDGGRSVPPLLPPPQKPSSQREECANEPPSHLPPGAGVFV